jgi:hypothetical protein
VDADEVFLDLVPNVLLTEARSSQAHLDALAELARTCDCYRLDTGRDFDALPRLLRGLVAEPWQMDRRNPLGSARRQWGTGDRLI